MYILPLPDINIISEVESSETESGSFYKVAVPNSFTLMKKYVCVNSEVSNFILPVWDEKAQ